jgi:hypothetical protein
VTFKDAVENTPDVQHAWRKGLQALKDPDKDHVEAEGRRLRGSVDLDAALAKKLPQERRWDYAVGYQHSDVSDEMIYWIEIHGASGSGNVHAVVEKRKALNTTALT